MLDNTFQSARLPQKCPFLRRHLHPHVIHVPWTHPSRNSKLHHHHHHHQHVACPVMDVAVLTSVLRACRLCAQWWAVVRPMLSGATSDSTVQSQVWCGWPHWQFQLLGKGLTLALRAWLWSVNGLACTVWPKNLRPVGRMMCMSCDWSVCQQTFSLEM